MMTSGCLWCMDWNVWDGQICCYLFLPPSNRALDRLRRCSKHAKYRCSDMVVLEDPCKDWKNKVHHDPWKRNLPCD
ncbi:hypothetical protein NPIL_62891 [Nephila pilipes]|uniref:Uncharacterized protein n=1 Tax=Nephila pilipes TaxID=299642 RepID=A0A8X6KQ87_NEPPI|nr:hypothetical protein NPIL_62891 [Nephila pilipes]